MAQDTGMKRRVSKQHQLDMQIMHDAAAEGFDDVLSTVCYDHMPSTRAAQLRMHDQVHIAPLSDEQCPLIQAKTQMHAARVCLRDWKRLM